MPKCSNAKPTPATDVSWDTQIPLALEDMRKIEEILKASGTYLDLEHVKKLFGKKDIIHAKQELQKIKMSLDELLKENHPMPAKIEEPVQKPKLSFIKKATYFALGILTLGAIHTSDVKANEVVYVQQPDGSKKAAYYEPQNNLIRDPTTGKTTPVGADRMLTPNGNVYIHGVEEQQKREQNKRQYEQPQQNDYQRKSLERYNYSTSKKYIDEANNAYKKQNYIKIINLTEDALDRINKGQLKATPEEQKKIEHRKGVGYELFNKTR